jgi:hypothetical protein
MFPRKINSHPGAMGAILLWGFFSKTIDIVYIKKSILSISEINKLGG